MYDEDDMLPVSALQHYLYCPRQCALIHLEQAWAENVFTAQGRQLHDRAHEGGPESRGDVRIVRGLRLSGRELGLTGQADVVEFHRPKPGAPVERLAGLPGIDGQWIVHPVEYKRGRPKQIDCDRVQLCAQAMCLEEMLNVRIDNGGLFYGQPRRREPVAFDDSLRDLTRRTASQVHELIRCGVTPPPEGLSRCRRCSLADSCMPRRTGSARDAGLYLRRQLRQALEPDSPEPHNHEEI
jgi:CRISPR-associated exonuclease Cas4